MKQLILSSTIILLLVCSVSGQVHTTLCNGNWDDPMIWNKNKVPADGDSIRVNHYIYITRELNLDSVDMELTRCGGICSADNFTLTKSTFYSEGYMVADTVWMYRSQALCYGAFRFTNVNVKGEGAYFRATPGICGYSLIGDKVDCFTGFAACTPGIMLSQQEDCEDSTYVLQGQCAQRDHAHLWYRNDTLLEGENDWTLPVNASGEYSCQVIDGDGNVSGLSNTIMVTINKLKDDLLPGQQDQNDSGLVKIDEWTYRLYPNPFSGVLQIENLDTTNYTIYGLTVYSTSGNFVGQFPLNEAGSLDLGFLPQGMYFARPLYLEGHYASPTKVIKVSK